MAIVQISQITNRLGLQADLPQLSGGELGWSTDTRQLYIGNGTLEQGAPVIGNTEILTEFSDILNLAAAYTYKGNAATGYTVQTGPTPSTPVVNSLQNWLDQYASVLDFGAVGDGNTDDTAAINRALNQLYCQPTYQNPAIRRSLFFPAGVYKVSGTINIPSYATLVGEGPENTIIQATVASNLTYVAQTADSLQQTGTNIGANGAVPPTSITVNNMAFQNLAAPNGSAILLVQSANSCHFTGVSFIGPLSPEDSSLATYGVTFGSTNSLLTQDISLQNCLFQGCTYGAGTGQQTKSILISGSQFENLYNGVLIGNDSASTNGFRITSNLFDNIYAEGIIFGANASINVSGFNMFYNVASELAGYDVSALYSTVVITGNNNVSIGDMFAKPANLLNGYQWVEFINTTSIATPNGVQLQMGTNTIESGLAVTLVNGTVSPTTAFTVSTETAASFVINYSIVRGGTRTGKISIAAVGGTLNYVDDYTESEDIGVALFVTLTGSTVSVSYTTNTSVDGLMNYSISYFN